LQMAEIKQFCDFPVVLGTRDDQGGIQEITDINGDQKRQKGNGSVKCRQRQFDRRKQRKPVCQKIRKAVGEPDQVVGKKILLFANDEGGHLRVSRNGAPYPWF
jgi:hypothetical protein